MTEAERALLLWLARAIHRKNDELAIEMQMHADRTVVGGLLGVSKEFMDGYRKDIAEGRKLNAGLLDIIERVEVESKTETA